MKQQPLLSIIVEDEGEHFVVRGEDGKLVVVDKDGNIQTDFKIREE